MRTKFCALAIVSLLAISSALLLLLLNSAVRLRRTKSEIQLARDLVSSIQADRDLALRGGATNAAFYLQRLREPPQPLDNVLADFVGRERKRAIKDIISSLRASTGRDYGDSPGPWIEAIEEGRLEGEPQAPDSK